MNFRAEDPADEVDDINPAALPPAPDEAVVADQRRHLRRILVAFVLVVVLLPFAGLGGALGWLLVPVIAVAAVALREAILLRRSVRQHGAGGAIRR